MLLGDAVHGMAPNLAQGACLAIEDALELARCIRCLHIQADQATAAETAARTNAIYLSTSTNPARSSFSASAAAATTAAAPATSASIYSALLRSSMDHYESIRRSRATLVQYLVPLVHKIGAMPAPLCHLRDALFGLFPAAFKTAIFDLTHRWALGWSYTAPNLGQGLYYRLLGARFMKKNTAFGAFHRHDVNRRCHGKDVQVLHGDTVLARGIAVVCQLPSEIIQGGEVELKVTVDPMTGSESWHRIFTSADGTSVSRFNTHQCISGEQLQESMGPLEFNFEPLICSDEKGFVLSLRDLKIGIPGTFWTLPVPRLFRPCVEGVSIHRPDVGGWDFDVSIRSPAWAEGMVGLIVRYRGTITTISTSVT